MMIIDLHFHTAAYSDCSAIDLEAGLSRAREMGLDGVCLTEHDVFPAYDNLEDLEKKHGLKIFVGVEVLTREGDILCYGLDEVPEDRIPARELVSRVEALGGASVAAHPHRQNGRGLGDLAEALPFLTAVEAYNGNTRLSNNGKAVEMSLRAGLPMTGGSDAHSLDRVGVYATRFDAPVETLEDLVRQLRGGEFHPVRYEKALDRYTDLAGRQEDSRI